MPQQSQSSPLLAVIATGAFTVAAIVATAILAMGDREGEDRANPVEFYYVPTLFLAIAGVICVHRWFPRMSSQGTGILWIVSGSILWLVALPLVLVLRNLIAGS